MKNNFFLKTSLLVLQYFVLVLGLIYSSQTHSKTSSAGILSFNEWKYQQIKSRSKRIELLKRKITDKSREIMNWKAKGGPSENVEILGSMESNLTQLQNQLNTEISIQEMSKDFSVADYFAAYLNKLPYRKEIFTNLATRLSPDEVAEIMTAYSKSISNGNFFGKSGQQLTE